MEPPQLETTSIRRGRYIITALLPVEGWRRWARNSPWARSADGAPTAQRLLRERAYGGTSGDITDPQLTLDFILAERGRELLWEGHRRTDLLRFGRLTGGTYIWAWKGGTLAGTATDAHFNLYPLPGWQLIA